MSRRHLGGLAAAALVGAALASVPHGAVAAAPTHGQSARALAAQSARQLIASKRAGAQGQQPRRLPGASPSCRRTASSTRRTTRTYRGLPVVGGDFVVVTDADGQVLDTSVAQTHQVDLALGRPRRSARPRRSRTARHQVPHVDRATPGPPRRLAARRRARGSAGRPRSPATAASSPSIKDVVVDARTGQVLQAREHVVDGTGTSAWDGPAVTIPTTLSGSTYSMKDPTPPDHRRARTPRTTRRSPAPTTSGATATRPTARPAASTRSSSRRARAQMLSAWLGRNGMDGSGGGWPIRVGLNDVNAYYDGTQVQIGHNTAGPVDRLARRRRPRVWATASTTTPRAASPAAAPRSSSPTRSARRPSGSPTTRPTPPDFTVGEEVNLVGSGPIRYMYNPSLAGDANCYSSSHPERGGARGGRPGQPLVLPAGRGHQPDQRPADQPDLQQLVGHRRRHPEGRADHVQRDADEDQLVVVPEVPHLDADRGQEPRTRAAAPVQRGQGRVERRVSVPAQSGDPTCTDAAAPTPSR